MMQPLCACLLFIDQHYATFHSQIMKLPRFSALICGTLVVAFSSAAQAQTTSNSPSKGITLELGNGAKMDFVLIPAGTFRMGAEDSRADEKPVTKVTITRPFYFGKYEVTQEQWQAERGSNTSYYTGTHLPVEQM